MHDAMLELKQLKMARIAHEQAIQRYWTRILLRVNVFCLFVFEVVKNGPLLQTTGRGLPGPSLVHVLFVAARLRKSADNLYLNRGLFEVARCRHQHGVQARFEEFINAVGCLLKFFFLHLISH